MPKQDRRVGDTTAGGGMWTILYVDASMVDELEQFRDCITVASGEAEDVGRGE